MKKLAIDIGNTFIKCGVFENNKIVDRASIKSAEEIMGILTKHSLSQIILCSVVPKKNKEFVDFLNKNSQAQIQNIHYKKTNLKLNVEEPKSVGNDRLCNVFGALKLYSAPIIIVDFGTATTYDVINKKNEFIGGIIAPGVETSTKNLISKAALLKNIDLVFPSSVIGSNTINNIQSGIMFGAVAQVEGLVKKIQLESKTHHSLILTGGFAKLISPHLNIDHVLEIDLTLKGMFYINESLNK
tara:strand:+ start:1753 stop:2478 length:726 start_codon:yes stop_codon:yes gene_type:complete